MEKKRSFVYVGSGDWEDEPGKVWVYQFDRDTCELTYQSDHPAGGLASFLAIDAARGRLYVADETGGGVRSFSIDRRSGRLDCLGAVESVNQPVYLTISEDRAHLLAANYEQGSVDVYPIGDDGLALESPGAVATGANCHCVVQRKGHVYVANKGADSISRFSFSGGKLTPLTPPTFSISSPRHVKIFAASAYVVSESTDTITALSIERDGTLTRAWETTRLDVGSPSVDTGGDVQITPDERFLYASNRGSSNTVVAYEVSGETPRYLQHVPTGGETPRNMALDQRGELLLVGNRGATKSLSLFSIQRDGRLQLEWTMPTQYSPFFVAFADF